MVSLILVDSNNQILEFFNNPWWAIAAPLSLIIGFIGLYAAFRKKQNVLEQNIIESFDIGKALKDEFPELCLTYNNNILGTSVWVIRGRIKNISDDIKIEKDNNEIDLKLPEDCKVIGVNINTSHEKFIVTHILKGNKIDNNNIYNNTVVFKITVGEFKSQEYFKYSILVETTTLKKTIDNLISVEQRFHNTEIVYKDERLKYVLPIFYIFIPFSLLIVFLSLIEGHLFISIIYLLVSIASYIITRRRFWHILR